MVQFSIALEYKLNPRGFCVFTWRPLQTSYLLSPGILSFRISQSLITMANREDSSNPSQNSAVVPTMKCYFRLKPCPKLQPLWYLSARKAETQFLPLRTGDANIHCHLAMQLGMQALDSCIAELVDYGITCHAQLNGLIVTSLCRS